MHLAEAEKCPRDMRIGNANCSCKMTKKSELSTRVQMKQAHISNQLLYEKEYLKKVA